MNDIYYCYSKRLMFFLRAMRESYISVGINKRANTKFWTFKKSDRLDELIKLWSVVKNK